MNPSQAGKPARASSMAGASTSSRDSRPNRAWASPQERTAPGTVMLNGPRRGSVRRPRSRRVAASAAAALRPEPLSAYWRASAASQTSQNASPPMPQPWGMTTPSTALVAIAASTALPPRTQDVQPGRRGQVVGRHDGAVRTAGERHRAPGSSVDHPIIPVTGSSARRNRASGRSAIRRSTAVATSMPSMPAASAANPPMSAPAICPIARNTE